MKFYKHCIEMLMLLTIFIFTARAAENAGKNGEQSMLSILRIPKLQTAPVIDGKIEKNQWKGAAAITGFINLSGMSLPQFLQPVWYFGYTDNDLYLAFRLPVFPPGSLQARVKTQVEAETNYTPILGDDHTEIEICNIGRENALSGYFYKLMTNPFDAFSFQKYRYSIGQPGYEYETNIKVKSTFTKDYWEQEIAIPLKDLGTKQIKNGEKWAIQLVNARNSGSDYYTWAPYTWLRFDAFPEIIFDPHSVSVQFVSVGQWMHGNPAFEFNVYNPYNSEKTLKFIIKITNSKSRILFNQTKQINITSGESKKIIISANHLKLDRFIGGQNNHVYIEVTDAKTNKIYYRNNMLLSKFGNNVEMYINNLKVAFKPVKPKLQFAYLPSFNKLIVSADVSLLGISPKISKGAKYLTASFKNEKGKIIDKNTAVFNSNGTAKLIFEFLPLSQGKYKINMDVLSSSGQILVSKKQNFEQKIFPFETFKFGTEDTVIPPYTSIKTGKNYFKTIGQKIELMNNGLIKQITNSLVPEEAGQSILAEPISIVLKSSNKKFELSSSKNFIWQQTTPAKVKGYSESKLKNLDVIIHSTADYTGQYLINLDLIPEDNVNVSLNELELNIPISGRVDTAFNWNPADTVWLYSKKHPYKGTPKEGILWTNLSERKIYPYIMYIGNGERGLYWYTDSFQGFWMNKNKPFIYIVKEKNCTVLKILFINKKCVINHPRHLRFAFISVPTKPLTVDYRPMEWNSGLMHLGITGWWGTIGCFVLPNKQGWENWINGKPFMYKGHPYPGNFPILGVQQTSDGKWMLKKGEQYATYRDASAIGYLQPEFKVFSGEWTGVTDPSLDPDASLLGYTGQNGKPIWPLPQQRSVYGMDMCTQSAFNYDAYYFYLQAKYTGAGGYWWDWGPLWEGHSLQKNEMYINDEGKPEPKTNLFMVRNFYERIARIDYQLGVKDTNNSYSPGFVCQVPWLTRMNAIESLYLETKYGDMFSEHGVDEYRAIIGKFSGIPVQLVMNIDINNLKNKRVRTVWALSLLFDNGIFGVSGTNMDWLTSLGFFNPATKWIPYWRSDNIVISSNKNILISTYINNITKRLLLVAVNPTKKDIKTNIIIKSAIKSGKDAENSIPLSIRGNEIYNLNIKSHDFHFLDIFLK
jgi:hypothetical protein